MTGATLTPAPRAKKKSAGKKSAAKKKARRGSAAGGERVNQVIDTIRNAGSGGISAKQVSAATNIPYAAVRKIVAETSQIQQRGELRASRLFLK